MKNEIKVYALDTLAILIGEDEKGMIKNACRVESIPQGIGITPIYKGKCIDKPDEIDIEKKNLNIISEGKPPDYILDAYNKYMTGYREGRKRIITPKIGIN